MSNHTKEKWLVDRQDYCICVEREGEALEIATLQPMDHNGIKHVIGEETWSNAYLMRTAPQLLDALEAMLEAHKQGWVDRLPKLALQAEHVIALAKAGSSPGDGGESEDMEI
ncbi:hypothetical protein V2L09_02685 [Pseudomonas alliivorans]|nr:hypothetical protein [Pseudomonas alliivorans]